MSATPKITATGIPDIIMSVGTDILTLTLKQMVKLHPSSVLDVLYMHRKIIV
jgi:hypothetical protein